MSIKIHLLTRFNVAITNKLMEIFAKPKTLADSEKIHFSAKMMIIRCRLSDDFDIGFSTNKFGICQDRTLFQGLVSG